MKVLQINAVYGFGSTGRIVQDIDLLLQEENIQSYVAYQKSKSLIANGYKIGNPIDWKLHAFLTRCTGNQAAFSIIPTQKLIEHIDTIKPDIIHLHNVHSNFLNLYYLLEYIKKKEIALVLTLHDSWFFTGKCFHFIDVN